MADITGTGTCTLPKLTANAQGYKSLPLSLGADTTLVAGTYVMHQNCDCNSYKLTYNCNAGNIVIKRSGDFYFTEVGIVDTTNSSATNKVYWTVVNDNTIGDTVPGSTGSPAVLGGSYNNGTVIQYNTTMKYWEIRWVDNKVFHVMTYSNAIAKILENITWKNCSYSSVRVLMVYGGHASTSIKYLHADNTNTFSGSSELLYLGATPTNLQCVYVQTSNTTGNLVQYHFNTGSCSYINLQNSGNYAFYLNDNRSTILNVRHCKTSFRINNSVGGRVNIFNSVITERGIYAEYAQGIGLYSCIFKSISTYVFNNYAQCCISAVRNCIFDSNAALVDGAIMPIVRWNGLGGVKNNGYYNNTSETNWVRGTYDTTISAPSWGNFPNGTLHTDWTTYGPGDGWYTTQDIATGADTNSFVGIGTTNQSHTGSTETATTQRLGIAPVFSAFS